MESIIGNFNISGFCDTFKISRSKTYEEINAGRLKAHKVGDRRLISKAAALNWQKICEEESDKEGVAA